jgi:hypothetical protein
VHLADTGVKRQSPTQGMFAGTAANHKDLHPLTLSSARLPPP